MPPTVKFDYTHASYDMNAGAAIAGNLPEEHVELVTAEPSQVPARSIPTSPEGSPPLRADMSPIRNQGDENFPGLDQLRTNLPRQSSGARPASASKSFSRPIPPQRPQQISRNVSQGGGAQMVLDAQSSWSGLADQTPPMQSTEPAGTPLRAEKAGGSSMLGFLSRKRGRDRSPKPKEGGVLGKAGARQIVSG
jgi:serine/threonine kinase 32